MQNYFWAVLTEIMYFSTERELKTKRSFIITDRVLQHLKSVHKKIVRKSLKCETSLVP